ncbi:hypothetical protein [Mycolicibacterium baixiangningiae]|uniref:hypothetical protein n=1 Tax=Mycolicibacterium baixiangningiae TaxID=2761578 RepID=UPI0018D19DCD|nr:hypothetical protein [Mycolicibacterium baixiangningiae]
MFPAGPRGKALGATLASWIVQRVADEDSANRSVTTKHVDQLLAEIEQLRGEVEQLHAEARTSDGQPPPA